ncbi:AarF/ABC1/UbiB kinase family protein [Spirulina sp. CS-785/01]|uniref:ABC1 kinase family protein n=1 Tax=Spirulina sp. CS-785/01 TaxID=3021716 RepID=UPI00232C06A0|nr:AarF/ABC1/UbiB kinase family protein [Spirulina sp. CS-785/01]MDB9311556.1 AarF/ABC1/UbiB kinase family protein [Spirulina sp. CS-785/01]
MSASSKQPRKQPRWQRKRYSPRARQIDIFSVALRFIGALGWDQVTGNLTSQRKSRRAQWLVQQMLELGPTFIKIGQALSTRADLIPLEYIKALEQLQDRVPPFDSETAISVVETELGNSLNGLFRNFELSPLASASLGQVHRAILHTGDEVVVKVQRPGLEKLFNLDFEVIHRLIRFLNRYFPKIRQYDLEGLYYEFFGLLFQEIDYIHEGKNAERFQDNFEHISHIIAPKVYWRYTTKRVLTLEYLPGIKIDDRMTIEDCNINPDHLIQLGITCYLKQLLEDGFFQSDPHPGNLAVSQDGKLIFYDFGTMTEVKSLAQDQMINTFFAVMRKDTEEVVNSLVYMGLLEPQPDMTPVKRLVGFVLDQFREKPVDLSAFDQMSNEVYVMFEQQPFRLPAQMMFVIKSVSTLDGIARALNPQYNLLAASQPFLQKLTQSADKGNLLKQAVRQTRNAIQHRLNKPHPVQVAVQRLEDRLDQGEFEIRVRSQVTERALKRLNMAVRCLIYGCFWGFTMLGGILLVVYSYVNWAIALFCISAFWLVLTVRILIRLLLRERLERRLR